MEKHSYLEKLIGKTVTKTDINTSTVTAIVENTDGPFNQKTSIILQLYLEEYLLNIYNPITIVPDYKEFNDLNGSKVIAVDENKEEARLIFNNGNVLTVNMRDEVYWDPEAMCLYGPDNFFVVWN